MFHRETSAIGKCDCGEEVELSHFTNTCQKCGTSYDSAGQRLVNLRCPGCGHAYTQPRPDQEIIPEDDPCPLCRTQTSHGCDNQD